MDSGNYMSINDAVAKYMAISGINSGSNTAVFNVRATMVWKELRNDVLKIIDHKWVGVDKTKVPYQAILPECASLLKNVGCLDNCNKYVAYTNFNSMPNVEDLDVKSVCNCKQGIKECIETYEKIEDDVILPSGTFTKTTIKKVLSNGDVYTYTNTPMENLDANGVVLPPPSPAVVYVDDETYVCRLDINECGCVQLSQENLFKINSCCTEATIVNCSNVCKTFFIQPNAQVITKNEDGYYSYEEKTRTVFLYGNIKDKVLMNFQTKGDSLDEEKIPDYAMLAFIAGMDFWNSRYSKTMNRFEKNEMERAYKMAKTDLEMMLPRNNFQIEDIDKNSVNTFSKWGVNSN